MQTKALTPWTSINSGDHGRCCHLLFHLHRGNIYALNVTKVILKHKNQFSRMTSCKLKPSCPGVLNVTKVMLEHKERFSRITSATFRAPGWQAFSLLEVLLENKKNILRITSCKLNPLAHLVMGTYEAVLVMCECSWGGDSNCRWWGHLKTTCHVCTWWGNLNSTCNM